ncbi:hypothetical protein BOX15_Mlig011319g1 [Macrostomum lignano]|uniref:Uncharacterized protein n=1 Tax=Macrostomum lignano TaxID=282301 RepID=A0A267GW69_9PLAT|nr:hypothetical protein BOX15_Mlig011319g1 [Macrostomum lignano]
MAPLNNTELALLWYTFVCIAVACAMAAMSHLHAVLGVTHSWICPVSLAAAETELVRKLRISHKKTTAKYNRR